MVTSNFGAVTDVPSGSFDYGGSAAWAPIRQLVDSQLQSDRPEVRLNYVNPAQSSPGSNSGLRMLLDGQLDFAQTARPLEPEDVAAARKQGFTLTQRPVAVDGVAVVVNPSLQVSGLTLEQLRQIYRGQITNWRQVGGPDLAITPFSQRPEDGDTLMFPQGGPAASFGSNVQYAYSTTEALREVSKTPGGYIMLLPERWFLNVVLNRCPWERPPISLCLPTATLLSPLGSVLVNAIRLMSKPLRAAAIH